MWEVTCGEQTAKYLCAVVILLILQYLYSTCLQRHVDQVHTSTEEAVFNHTLKYSGNQWTNKRELPSNKTMEQCGVIVRRNVLIVALKLFRNEKNMMEILKLGLFLSFDLEEESIKVSLRIWYNLVLIYFHHWNTYPTCWCFIRGHLSNLIIQTI